MVMRATYGICSQGIPAPTARRQRIARRCPIRAQYELPTSRYLEVSGLKLHYSIEGRGPPLLLLHGVAASLHTWDGWARALSPFYQIIRIDLPGCGLSDSLREREHYSPEYTLGLFERIRMRLKLEQFHLAGNSLGGFFSWYYAAHHPERVDKLVLLSPIGYPQNLPALFTLLAARGIGECARYVSPRFAVAHGVRSVYGDRRAITRQVVDRYHALAGRGRNRHALVETVRRLKHFARDPQLASHVRKIRAPTLLMWGQKDRLVPPSMIDLWRRDLGRLELRLYPDAGHIPMEEIPYETARDAHRFLARDR